MNIRAMFVEECRAVADRLEQAIARHGIRCPGGFDLDRMVKACRWMGTFPDGTRQRTPHSPQTRSESGTGIPLCEQTRRVATAIARTEEAPGLLD